MGWGSGRSLVGLVVLLAAGASVPDLSQQPERPLPDVRTFLDEVRFNPKGNEVTLIKRRESAREVRSCKS